MINPCYEEPNIAIYCGDVLEVMKDLPENSIDLIVTDPPYGISKNVKGIKRHGFRNPSMRRQADINRKFGEWDLFPSPQKKAEFVKEWFRECARVSKKNASFYSFYDRLYMNHFADIVFQYNFKVRDVLCWHKTNPCPQILKVGYSSSWEAIIFLTRPKHFFNYKLGHIHNHIESGLCQGRERTEHPTQKPEKIIKILIERSSEKGDIILDPFLGSGTTLVACKELGRRGIGIEINPKYCDIAVQRLKNTTPNLL